MGVEEESMEGVEWGVSQPHHLPKPPSPLHGLSSEQTGHQVPLLSVLSCRGMSKYLQSLKVPDFTSCSLYKTVEFKEPQSQIVSQCPRMAAPVDERETHLENKNSRWCQQKAI